MADTYTQRAEREKQEHQLLETLGELGGQRPTEDDLTWEGTKIVLPVNRSLDEVIDQLTEFRTRDQQTIRLDRTYRYRPYDGALAVDRAFKRAFGMSGRQIPRFSLFGTEPPPMVTVTVGPRNETVQAPWGQIDIPLFKGTMSLGVEDDAEFGPLFAIMVTTPRRFRSQVEGLFKLIQKELEENSIYKGKAIDGQDDPEFLSLDKVDPAKVIYTPLTVRQFEVNVWSLFRYTEQMRDGDLPLKRAVLLHGKYGKGKTLAGYRTAQLATEHGWTFLYCKPDRDDLETVMATARLYEPACVFFEDIDVIAEGTDRDRVVRLLDLFDGLTAKGADLMVVLTTNHPERIHKALLRAGRMDSVIEVGDLGVDEVRRMVESLVKPELLDSDIDWEAVFEQLQLEPDDDGPRMMAPAFIKEAIDDAKRTTIVDNNGELGVISTQNLIDGAVQRAAHLKLMDDARDDKKPDRLSTVIEATVEKAVDGTLVHREDRDETFATLRRNGE